MATTTAPFAAAAMRASASMLARCSDAQCLPPGSLTPVPCIFKAEAGVANVGLGGVAIEEPYIIAAASALPDVSVSDVLLISSPVRNIQDVQYAVQRVVPRNQLGQVLLVLERP